MFRVALVQKKAVPNQKKENLRLAIQFVTEASECGADLVLFPEMWSNAYAPPFAGAFEEPLHPDYEKERLDWLEDAIETDSAYVKALQETAREHSIGIVATYLSRASSQKHLKPQNTAIIINRAGEIILNYAKVHTCDFSLEMLLQSGEAFQVCEFDGIAIGVMICYDREFPESARVLMRKGAELIVVPNACDMNPARLQQLSTRAFENMTGIAMANYPSDGWGASCAFSPIVFDENGNYQENTLLMADDKTEDILIAGFDMEKIRAYRKEETWGDKYRKPHAYEI